ncbi:extracellular solute-binding protein, family 3 [Paucidesulfovibrio gracilis DSM 16080]|uniref:Extracellular solute-binding protein, family 3 n=2 Tax=Paucidesulfovibrio TaxID=2910985 RepID=A0A1T4X9P2_9BACT|nr:extracellular solute-binding protein, family 3 [Paucidesulfovibrio gracilis DSM 16080]
MRGMMDREECEPGTIQRKAIRRLVALGVMLLCVLGLAANVVAGDQQGATPQEVLLTTHERCPYGCYDEAGYFDGTAVRMVRQAFECMGISVRILVVPWKRAQKMAWDGHVDGFFAASHNAEREHKGVFSEVVAGQKWNWYLLKTSQWDPFSPEFRSTASVGAFQGANMLHWLRENGYNIGAAPRSPALLLEMLLDGRIDAALGSDQAMGLLLEERGLRESVRELAFRSMPLAVCFTRDFAQRRPEVVRGFNECVRRIRAAMDSGPECP